MRWRNYFVRTDLINDYIRLAAVSIAMGLAIGAATLGIHLLYEFYAHYVDILLHVNRYLILLLPTMGIPAAFVLVDQFSTTKASGGGSHRLLEAYHYEGGRMTLKDTVFEPLGAAVTVGFGGSAGFEGPSLLLGGGMGSLLGQRLGLGHDDLRIFLLSGAAAGVSAIFKAPLTGIMFALEIPFQRDLSREAFIPATLASISAYLMSVRFLGIERLFPLLPGDWVPEPMLLVHAFLIGILTAAVGAVFVKLYEGLGKLKGRLGLHKLWYPVIGGFLVGVIGFFVPDVLGVGYETIQAFVGGGVLGFSVGRILLLVVLKMVATCVTLNSGGSGGVFVPTLFVGAGLGALYTTLVPDSGGTFLIVASMASTLAAANNTLLTSVAFVAETAGPSSLIFALVSAATSYFVSQDVSFYEHVQPLDELIEEEEAVHVLYHIVEKGENLHRLREVRVEEFMWREPLVLPEGMRVSRAIKEARKSRFREYPVIRRNRLVGVVTLEDILTIPASKRDLTIGHLRMDFPQYVRLGDTLADLLPILMQGNKDCVWVVEDEERMRLVGVVSQTDVMLKLLETIESEEPSPPEAKPK